MDWIWTDRNNITIEKLKILFLLLPFLVLMKIFISQAKKKGKEKTKLPKLQGCVTRPVTVSNHNSTSLSMSGKLPRFLHWIRNAKEEVVLANNMDILAFICQASTLFCVSEICWKSQLSFCFSLQSSFSWFLANCPQFPI